jgi:hypothetical protein
MPVDVTNTLKEALAKLAAEKRRIERQTAAIKEALRAVNGAPGGRRSTSSSVETRGAKRGRRRMSPAERKAVGRRMKAYWAKRKKGASGPRKAKSTK